MVRRSDPRRIHQARRVAIRNLLVDEQRLAPDQVDAWLTAWEIEAERLALILDGDFWTIGSVWIREQRAKHGTPPSATDHAA